MQLGFGDFTHFQFCYVFCIIVCLGASSTESLTTSTAATTNITESNNRQQEDSTSNGKAFGFTKHIVPTFNLTVQSLTLLLL